MYYRGNLPPVKCPRCGTLNNQVREECRYYNCPLDNYCSDEECGELNVKKARFCKRCGKPTTFNQFYVFDDAVVQRYTTSAWNYYLINGDPDTPEAKAEQARRQWEYRAMMSRSNRRYGGMFDSYDDPDDFPEPPLEPDYIPYY